MAIFPINLDLKNPVGIFFSRISNKKFQYKKEQNTDSPF